MRILTRIKHQDDMAKEWSEAVEAECKDLMNKAWNKWLGEEDDNHLFAWHFSFEVEAAHGIKGDA